MEGVKNNDFCVKYVDFSQKKLKKAKNDVKSVVSSLKPAVPVYFCRPNALKRSISWFLENFSGFRSAENKVLNSEILYSVKSNPDEEVLRALFAGGVRHFDVASIKEVRLVADLFGEEVRMSFMHPMKPREAIREAYFEYGVRDFSLDSAAELKKIMEETDNARDLGLHLRLAIPNSHAAIDLSGKFGILPGEAVGLARKIRGLAKRFGLCFHVGSQCMDPTQFRAAIGIVGELLAKSKVKLDVLDVGGGFPSAYPGMTPPELASYVNEIRDTVAEMDLEEKCEIWCEPGRALVAESGSLLVRVEGRKGNMLYINDGTYGGLFDAGMPGFIYPMRAFRVKRGAALQGEMEAFGFYGPTCDSLDVMKGPFYLPRNINEGDYIEIGQLGAYSGSLRTGFNGFDEVLRREVVDEPIMSLFLEGEAVANASFN